VPYDLDRDDCNPPGISDKHLGKRVLSTGTAARAYFTLTGQFSPAVWSKYCANMRLGVIGGLADCEKLVLAMAHDRLSLVFPSDCSTTQHLDTAGAARRSGVRRQAAASTLHRDCSKTRGSACK
jgi:hypothetical protein